MAETLLAALYGLNILAYFLLFLLAPVYFTRRFQITWLNPLLIPVLAALPILIVNTLSGPFFFLEDGLDNVYFQYALLVSNVHTLAGLAALVWLVHFFTAQPRIERFIGRLANADGPARPERMRTAAWIFLGLYLLSFLLLTHDVGLINWILDPRTNYQLHRTGVGEWYALGITFLSTSLVLATLYARSTHSILGMALFYFVAVFMFGQKSLVVSYAIYIIIVLAIRQYRYLKPVGLILLSGAAYLVGSLLASSFGSVGLEQISTYSDYFVNAAHYYQGYLTGTVPLFHGEVTLSGLWGLAPRALFPDKPHIYGTILVTEIFFPGAAENTYTPAFSTVDYFADFGWPQTILSGLLDPGNILTAFLYALVLPRMRDLNVREGIGHRRGLTYGFLWLAAPSYLLFFDFPNNFLLFGLIAMVISLTNRVRIARSVPAPLPPLGETQV